MSPSVIPAWRNSGEERTGELLAQGLYVAQTVYIDLGERCLCVYDQYVYAPT